jgi:hypothetical protein
MNRITSASIAAFALGFASVAEAQDMSVMMDLQKNCLEDAKVHCAKDLSKPELLMQCLVDNQEKLSAPCKAATSRMAKTLGLKPKNLEG